MKKRHSEKNQETVGVLYLVYESSYINFIKYITPILERFFHLCIVLMNVDQKSYDAINAYRLFWVLLLNYAKRSVGSFPLPLFLA